MVRYAPVFSNKAWPYVVPKLADFYFYSERSDDLARLNTTYPQISHLETIGYSVQGQINQTLKVSDNPNKKEVEPETHIIGCYHGNEKIFMEMTYHLVEYLVSNYATDPYIHVLIDHRKIWIIPLMNLGGLVAGHLKIDVHQAILFKH